LNALGQDTINKVTNQSGELLLANYAQAVGDKVYMENGKAKYQYTTTTYEPIVYETESIADWYNPFTWGDEKIT